MAELNRERITALADYLDSIEVAKFNMEFWYGRIDGRSMRELSGSTAEEFTHECGTFACGAGHAVALFDPDAVLEFRSSGDDRAVLVLVNGVRKTIPAYAAELLGLTDSQAFHLFNEGAWPNWAFEKIGKENELQAFVAMLRAVAENGPDVIYREEIA